MRSTARTIAALALALTAAVGFSAPSALAQTGGSVAPGGSTGAPAPPLGPAGKAKLKKNGKAIAPRNAPVQVQMAINAGNQIRKMPYEWGGGHGSFFDSGYDCSGAVSYVLHGAGLIDDPLPSGSLASSWGSKGKGRWITVYANGGHTYVVVAGLRFDTSAVGENLRRGSGPRWRATKRTTKGYTPKYYPSL
ncbi:hypothetical protein BH20ACT15_BH20ACT15_03410 [soil metagenome]